MTSSTLGQNPQGLGKPGRKWLSKLFSLVVSFNRFTANTSSCPVDVDQSSNYTSESDSLNPYARLVMVEGANGQRKQLVVRFDTQSDTNLVSAKAVAYLEPLKLSPTLLPSGHAHEYSSPLPNSPTVHPTHFIRPRLILPEIGLDQRQKLKIVKDAGDFDIILGHKFIRQYKEDHGVSLMERLEGLEPVISCRGTVAVLIRDKKKSMDYMPAILFLSRY